MSRMVNRGACVLYSILLSMHQYSSAVKDIIMVNIGTRLLEYTMNT